MGLLKELFSGGVSRSGLKADFCRRPQQALIKPCDVEDPQARAQAIADLLTAVYGDRVEAMFDAMGDGEKQDSGAQDENLKSDKTPAQTGEMLDYLNLLTTLPLGEILKLREERKQAISQENSNADEAGGVKANAIDEKFTAKILDHLMHEMTKV